jgi:two-component system phosphate regulon sensor histidine kinase PhoR
MESDIIETTSVAELIELNEELENYFVNTIIPQLFIDARLILRKYTPPAMKQFKFSSVHIGRPLSEMIDNIRCSTLIEDVQGVINSGDILEKEIQTTDQRWYQMNIVPYIEKKQNRVNGVIITFVDITERIHDIKELEYLNAAHETFIYSVSHDLKGPLGNIESLIGILTEVSTDEKEKENISGMLNKAIKNMRMIIEELSEITKIEGNYKETIDVVNFKQIIKEVELIMRDKIIACGAHIHTDIVQAEVTFSRKNIRSILSNLLSNAIKYCSPDRSPEITIRTDKQGEYVVITVTDNGIGIPADKLAQVFTKFSRIEKNIEGSGIGLYLVNKIVENNTGKIEVTSNVGEGSVFKIYLKSI